MTQELPQGWVECELGDVAQVIGGGTPDSQNPDNFSATSGIAWLTPADLSDHEGIYVSHGKRFLTKKGYSCSSARLMPKGTVLFSSRAPIGYVAVAVNEISTNQGFKSFVCVDGILPEFIYFWLRYATPIAESMASGTTFAEISGKNAARIPLLLPPLVEQQRIVAKLEVLLGKVDACRKRLEKIPVILKRFRQSVLAAACSGRLTADWRENSDISEGDREFFERVREQRLLLCKTSTETQRIEQSFSFASSKESVESDNWLPLKAELICDFITKGTTPKEIENGSHGDIPFLKVYNIVDNKIVFSSKPQFVSRKTHEGILRRSAVYPGDVVMNIVGPPLAKVAVVPLEYREWNINQAIAIFRPIGSVKSEFLRISLLGSKSLREIIAQTRGIVGQSNLSLEQCRNLELEVPPLPEQHEIVRRVETLFALADQIEIRYAKAKTHVDRLTQSILAKAFRGDLVSQDPSDEPATVLLKRIREEQEGAGVVLKKTRQKGVTASGAAR